MFTEHFFQQKILVASALALGAVLSCLLPTIAMGQKAHSPLFLPDYPGHLGVDIQAPGGQAAQEDAPVVWNGPPAEVFYIGTISKATDAGDATSDSHGDGYGTMLVKLRVTLPSAQEFATEVSMQPILEAMIRGEFDARALPQDTMPGLLALRENPALVRSLRPLLRRYKLSDAAARTALEQTIADKLGIRLRTTETTVNVLIGHLRPSEVFVDAVDPAERLRIGREKGETALRVGSWISSGMIIGYIERKEYAGETTEPHVHIGVYVPRFLPDRASSFRGTNVADTSIIREGFLEAESALRILAGFAGVKE